MIYNILQSIKLLSDACYSFADNCVIGIEANKEHLAKLSASSLMMVTCLNPHIGYDNAAKIAKCAFKENITLKQAAVKLGLLSEAQFDELVVLKNMI
jgi:fumarate hydratase, class II